MRKKILDFLQQATEGLIINNMKKLILLLILLVLLPILYLVPFLPYPEYIKDIIIVCLLLLLMVIITSILLVIYYFLSNKNSDKIFTKEELRLIKQIRKRKIINFETLIIKYLKPKINKLENYFKIFGIEYKPNDKVYKFNNPDKTKLKINSMVKVLTLLLDNNVITLNTKYEKIDKNKTLNPFYTFEKHPTIKHYEWFKHLNDVLSEHFDIKDYDKEVQLNKKEFKKYIKYLNQDK